MLTDIGETRWSDAVVDAESMPFDDQTVANLVLIDVLHHLGRPAAFFDEACRVLAPGGRVVILDPYCSPVSTLAYRWLHDEPADLSAPAFADDPAVGASVGAANQARATLVFFRRVREFAAKWPTLEVIERMRLAALLYPLSGGFSRPQLVPLRLYGPLRTVERLLAPAMPLLAFRCAVILERV
jgi:SAM-dependent methyltransferase